MFHFFSKKEYLVDHLSGFVDIHNHILPGIDDGAKTVEDSIELIKGFGEFGVNNFICTPHIMENYYANNPTSILTSLALLKNELKMQGMASVKIAAAAEHMIDAGFEKLLDTNTMMPLAASYILIEMSYLQPSINFDEALIKIKEKGFFPILAHPERYVYLHSRPHEYKRLKKKGLLFQTNMLSFSDYYGKDVKKMAHKLLEENLVDFIASDVHKIAQVDYLKKISLSKKTLRDIQKIIEKTIYNFLS